MNIPDFVPIYITRNADGTFMVSASGVQYGGQPSPAAALADFANMISRHPGETQFVALQLYEQNGLASLAEAFIAAYAPAEPAPAPNLPPMDDYENPVFDPDDVEEDPWDDDD